MDLEQDSIFREYIMYMDIMLSCGEVGNSPFLTREGKQMAERFAREYPDSWLLPQVYRRLFWQYATERDKDKAEVIRNEALRIAPHAVILRDVRECDLSKR